MIYISQKKSPKGLLTYWRLKNSGRIGPPAEGPSRGPDIGYALGYSLVRKQDLCADLTGSIEVLLEQQTGLEPATSSLATRRSTK